MKKEIEESKLFRFKIHPNSSNNEKRLLEILSNLDNLSDEIRTILIDYFITKKLRYNNNYDEKIKRQKYLKLCLENWNALKNSGHIYEEAKAIVIGDREISEPMVSKLDENNFCYSCKHQHANTEPKVCKNIDCPCGVIQ